jgi:hypothetical protein
MNLIILLFAYVFHSRYEGYDMRNVVIQPTILEIKNEILLKKEFLVTEDQTVFDKCKIFYKVKKIITTLEDNNIHIHRKLQIIEQEQIEFTSNKITRCDITKGGLYTFWNE